MEVSISKIRTVFKRWYILFLVGVLSLAVGIAIYSLPAISLPFLLLMCSMFLVVVGIREIIYISTLPQSFSGRLGHLIFPILLTVLGFALLAHPFITYFYMNAMLVVLLFSKVFQNIVFHFTYSKRINDKASFNWTYNLILVVIAVLFWSQPSILSVLLITLSGFPFLILGIGSISISLFLRRSYKKLQAFKESFKKNTVDIEYEVVEQSLS